MHSRWTGMGPEERRLRVIIMTSEFVLSAEERGRIKQRINDLQQARSDSPG